VSQEADAARHCQEIQWYDGMFIILFGGLVNSGKDDYINLWVVVTSWSVSVDRRSKTSSRSLMIWQYVIIIVLEGYSIPGNEISHKFVGSWYLKL
jgi:hypothetical protein